MSQGWVDLVSAVSDAAIQAEQTVGSDYDATNFQLGRVRVDFPDRSDGHDDDLVPELVVDRITGS